MPPGRPRRVPHTHIVVGGQHYRARDGEFHGFAVGEAITPSAQELRAFPGRFEALPQGGVVPPAEPPAEAGEGNGEEPLAEGSAGEPENTEDAPQ